MKLVYGVKDKPSWGKTIVFALQQLLAVLAATIAVPAIINSATGSELSQAAALFGAGCGTLVYCLFTKFKSPVFLGSSFAFIGSMITAFAGAASMSIGYLGLIIGAVFAGLVYVIIALIVKKFGAGWVNKIMPAVVIGPTVAIIGLSLAGNAIKDLIGFNAGGVNYVNSAYEMNEKSAVCLVTGLVTLFTTITCSVYGKKMVKMIPFIIGICTGYIVALIFTGFGYACKNDMIKLINFEIFTKADWSKWYPDLTIIKVFNTDALDWNGFGAYMGTLAVAYIPVAFVVFAEHIADHKNLSSIIESDLLQEPGLHRTLLGDGVGSMVGAFFGGCPNTTYGESVGCVAISGNASVRTIYTTAGLAILLSFILPFTLLLSSIPGCVMGGVCVALYGFIAVSGLKMLQKVDLGDNRNLFVASTILISGVGGFALTFCKWEHGLPSAVITLSSVAVALILGILVNVLVNFKKTPEEKEEQK